ncbi:MAG: choice-of-anchor Q domain-containing protein, partial [Chloroflexota bacterium]
FAKNIANDAGAAVFNNGIGSAIKHSTITADPPNNRQAVYVWGEMEVHNTIITNHDIALAVSGKLNADHNLFQGNANDVYPYRDSIFTGGDNSITAADVRFVDAANDDFRIQANSPAIDRGSASTTTADANGNARPYLQTGVDIGAYEYQGKGIAAIALTKQGPPWFNSFEQVSYDLILENSGIFTATNLVITESLPAGTVYVPDSITNGGTYADRVVTWTVETLAPGEDLRFEYTVTGTVDIVSNDYAVVSQDNPAVQATGETITTSINASLVANWNFYPNPQGYSFPNYSDSPDSDLTAEDMVFIFGEVVCKTTNPCVLTATAEQWRKDRIEGVKGGHCAGMAMSSLQLFQDPLVNPINYQSGADMTHDLTKPNIRKLIGLYAMTQFSLPIDQTGLADVAYRHDGTINVLNQLIENLDDPDANDRYQLNFYLPDMTAGHAVVPFAVEEKEDNEYWVYVYDNNYPNANDRVFKVNRATGDWIYEGAATVPGAPASDWQGTGDGENQLLLISTAWTTNFPKICTTACTPDESRSPFDTNPLDIQLDGEAHILITRNEDGKRFGSDLTTGALIDEIDGAERILNTNGMGLKLPGTMRIPHTAGSTYTIEIANRDTAFGNTAAPVNLSIFGLGKAFRLTDLDLNDPNSGQIIVDQAGPTRASMANAEQDKVNISFKPDSNEIAFKTSAIDADTPDIAMAINNPAGEDFTFELSNISVAADSTVSMAFDESAKELSFGDDDTTTDPTYNLDTTRTNPDGSSDTVSQEDVTDGQGSGGSISFENWDGESTPEVEEIADVFTIHLPMVNR